MAMLVRISLGCRCYDWFEKGVWRPDTNEPDLFQQEFIGYHAFPLHQCESRRPLLSLRRRKFP